MNNALIGCLLLGLTIVPMATAQEASQQPASQQANRSFRGGSRSIPQDVRTWASTHMPNLLQLALNQGPRYRMALQNHFRTIETTHDDKTRDRILLTYKQEDVVYGYVIQWQNAAAESKAKVLEKINVETRHLVAELLNERQVRIDGLRKQLDDQERKLAQDRQNIDQLVADRVNSRFLPEGATTRQSNDSPANESQPPIITGAERPMAAPQPVAP